MKYIFLVISFLLCLKAFADGNIALSTSKATYSAGERAVLVVRVVTQPTDSRNEYFFTAKLNAVSMKITPISSSVAYAVTKDLPAGSYSWEVQTFIQNKFEAQKLNETIVFFEQEVRDLQRKIADEKNVQVIAVLQNQVARDNAILQNANVQLNKIRSSVSTQTVSFIVNPPTKSLVNRALPTLSISADSSTGIYLVGSSAQFTVNLSGTSLNDEEAEWTFDATIPAIGSQPAITLDKTINSPTQVTFSSPAFPASASGWRQFLPQFKYRLKNQYTKFKEAISLAVVKKAEYIQEKNRSNDPKRIAFYELQISEIDMLVSALSNLGLKYQPFDSTAFDFKIKDGSLPKGIQYLKPSGGLELTEGGGDKILKVRLTSDPDTDVTVNFDTGIQIKSISSLTFTSHNWNVYQEVWVGAYDDNVIEGDHYADIVLTASGTDYSGISNTVQAVLIHDNDFAWDKVVAGGSSVCAIKNGALYCWGSNVNGELGMGDTISRAVPTLVPTMSSGVIDVAGTDSHRCANKNSTLFCWGRNNYGQVGVGTTIQNYLTPTQITSLPVGTVTSVTAGYRHSCAVSSLQAYCWGDNSSGQLGINSTTASFNTPQLVLGPNRVVMISAGTANTCLFDINPVRVLCMGDNSYGQIGDGTTTLRRSPTLVTGSNSLGITGVAVGMLNKLVCLSHTTGVKCWGDGIQDGFGNNGASFQSSVPVSVSNITTWTSSITVGDASACAITDSKIKCWGRNYYGNIGDGTTQNSAPVPKDINIIYGSATGVSTNGNSTCGIIDAKIKCWGSGSGYMLGNGNTTDQPLPVPIVEPLNFKRFNHFNF